MKVVKIIMHTLLVSVGGAVAGGAAAGATMMLVTAFPQSWQSVGIVLAGTMMMASLGPVGGVLFGFIPTLVLGTLLSLVRRWRPFDHVLVWVGAGGAAGLAIPSLTQWGMPSSALNQESAWLAGWAASGCTAMLVYWAWGPGRLERRPATAAAADPARSGG